MNKTNPGFFLRTGNLVATLLLLHSGPALAESQAAQARHLQVGFTSGDTYTSGGNDSNSYGVNGSIAVPLAAYLSGSLSGSYAHTRFANDFLSNSSGSTPTGEFPACGTNNGREDAGLFVRQDTWGKLGIGYGAGKIDSRCNAAFLATDGDTLRTKNYTVNAEYYFSKVTVATAWNRTQLGVVGDLDTAT